MVKEKISFVFLTVCLLLAPAAGSASSAKAPQMRPATVAVGTIAQGRVRPRAVWVGTVRYPRISKIAAEISGKVDGVDFDEGLRVKKGDILVTLDVDLRKKALAAQKALAMQAEADLENARLSFARIKKLYQEKSVAEQHYDEQRLTARRLSKQLAFHKRVTERLEIELAKADIRAPFDGVVLAKQVEVGEWVAAGSVVATVADDSLAEVVVSVTEGTLPFLRPGMEAAVQVGGATGKGEIFSLIPKGDVVTRTFPVKVRIVSREILAWDGMEARVALPSGPEETGLVLNRDAVLGKNGKQVIFLVQDGKARMTPVTVLGYEGQKAGIRGQGLAAGMQVVTKGQERLRDGQPLRIVAP